MMKKLLPAVGVLLVVLSVFSCGSADYMVFSLREGIGHFSMEYPSSFEVTRIDIRNEASNRYTHVGLSISPAAGKAGLHEISVYA